jgi:hypothetical protein
MIPKIHTVDDILHTDQKNIIATFLAHYKALYGYTTTDKHRWQRFLDLIATWPHLTPEEQTLLAKLLDEKEVLEATKL